MQVCAVQREIRSAVACLGMVAERHRSKAPARQAVEHPDRFGAEGCLIDGIEGADLPQSANGVGTKLDSGTGLLLEGGAFEDVRCDLPPGKRDGSREAADAAAGNENAPLL